MSELVPTLQSLAVVTPGSSFGAAWLSEWDMLFYSLMGRFFWRRVYAQSNNIYQVRESAAKIVLAGGVPDYVLWIDSDNPPKQRCFDALMAQMRASERNVDPSLPSIDIIGAWYRYSGPDDEKSYIAAGRSAGLRVGQIAESEVLQALQRNELIDDLAFIGFGMLLMRGSVLAKLGPQGFWPMAVDDARGFLTDDVSWCARAKAAGYRIFLHPGAFLDHIKSGPVQRKRGALSPVVAISDSISKLEEIAS